MCLSGFAKRGSATPIELCFEFIASLDFRMQNKVHEKACICTIGCVVVIFIGDLLLIPGGDLCVEYSS